MVAIDGPAGAGKSTTACLAAQQLGYVYLDTGAMYRAVTLLALRRGIDVEDGETLAQLARELDIAFRVERGHLQTWVDGEDVSEDIRSAEVNRSVSAVSRHPEVRRWLVDKQRHMGEAGGVVVEGRDIGTVVFPCAEVKIYLDATLEERARRRWLELRARGIYSTVEEQVHQLKTRDRMDSLREDSPLRKAEDAVVVDTSNMSIPEQVEAVVTLCERAVKSEK